MFFSFCDPSVRAIGRWGEYEGVLQTISPGAKLEVAFQGDYCVLHFDLKESQYPYPHLWVQIDDGARFEVPLDYYLRIECENGDHILTVILKSVVENQHRWYHPLVAKVAFKGYEAQDKGCLPTNNRKTIELIGDSITEGALVSPEYMVKDVYELHNRVYQNDACATYAYRAAMALGLEPLCGGYSAEGVTRRGQGSVPVAPDMYPFCFDGVPIGYPHPDYVLINHGTNDFWSEPQRISKEYTRLLNVVRKCHPNSQIIVMTPFCGELHDELIDLVMQYNQENKTNIALIDTKGWLPRDPIHPLRDGHAVAAKKLEAALREIV